MLVYNIQNLNGCMRISSMRTPQPSQYTGIKFDLLLLLVMSLGGGLN